MISRRSYASRSETNFQNSPFLQHPARHLMLIRLFQHTTICWGLGLKRQVRKVQRIPDAVVRGRDAGGSETKESLEGRHGLLSAIVPKDELVEVGLELRAADPVMRDRK